MLSILVEHSLRNVDLEDDHCILQYVTEMCGIVFEVCFLQQENKFSEKSKRGKATWAPNLIDHWPNAE